MKIKVALCLSGMPRDIDYTWPFFEKNLLGSYDVDVFGAFWIDKSGKDDGHGLITKPYEHFNESFFIDLCKPKIVKFTELNDLIIDKVNEINNLKLGRANIAPLKNYRALCMLYMIEQADKLRQEYELYKGNYDVVIRCRSDLVMYNTPNLHNLNPKTIYMSKFITAPGINDTCWWSDRDTADIFSNTFSFFNYFDFSQIKAKTLEPEHIMSIFATINKIKFEWTDDTHQISRWVKQKNE